MVANPFERCPSVWKVPYVRCDRWGGHAGEHRGFDDQDLMYRWSDEHVPWNQPVPDNLEVDKDRRMGDSQQMLDLKRELQQVRVERDAAKKGLGQVGLQLEEAREELKHAMEQLRTIRRLTNGVPTRADA